MFGGKSDWLKAHAEPVQHSAWFGGNDAEGHGGPTKETQWLVGASLDATWRIHIPGREPYDVVKSHFDVPGWVVEGSLQGSRRWHVRVGGGNGLLREVGVPCLVHPEKPDKIDFDWKAAYKLHEPVWDKQDAIAKRVAAKNEGVLGKVIGQIQYFRPAKFTEAEKAEIEAAADVEVAKIQRHTGAEMVDQNLQLNGWLHAEAQRLQATATRVTGKVKSRRPVPYEGILNEMIIDLAAPDPAGRLQVGYRFPLVGRKLEAATRPGKQVVLLVDPDKPDFFVLEAHLVVETW